MSGRDLQGTLDTPLAHRGVSRVKDDVVNAGATYVDREVVRDGRLITSRTPDDLPAFMRAILDALAEGFPSTSHGRKPTARATTRR